MSSTGRTASNHMRVWTTSSLKRSSLNDCLRNGSSGMRRGGCVSEMNPRLYTIPRMEMEPPPAPGGFCPGAANRRRSLPEGSGDVFGSWITTERGTAGNDRSTPGTRARKGGASWLSRHTVPCRERGQGKRNRPRRRIFGQTSTGVALDHMIYRRWSVILLRRGMGPATPARSLPARGPPAGRAGPCPAGNRPSNG